MKKFYHILMGKSIRAVYIYRISSWFYKKKIKPFGQVFWSLNVALHGIEISPLAKVGSNFRLAHTVGTVIGDGAIIGDNVTIYQNVTLGSKLYDKELKYPTLGNGVSIYPGSIIIGDIKVGDNAVIGANSVVLRDVPSGAVVAGSPAKIVN